MKTNILQSKPKNKLLNRVFAIASALIILIWMCYWITSCLRSTIIAQPTVIEPIIGFIIIIISYSIIVVGLLIETWKPSLDFNFHRNRKWIFASIILFAVFILSSVYWWLTSGFPHWLPEQGLQATLVEWFTGNFVMETSSLSLMFGILFLTKSAPQKSLSYKTILIGTVSLEFMFFLTYITAIAGLVGPEQFKDFLGFTIFQPWFWLDFTAEITIFIGAFWLLVKGKED